MLVNFIREQTTISAIKGMSEVLPTLAASRHGQVLTPQTVNCRVIVLAYPILLFPGETFGSIGPSEDEVIAKARALIECTEAIMTAVDAGETLDDVPWEITEGYCNKLREFLVTFHTWKDSDTMPIPTRIMNALSALYSSPQNAAILAQIVRLRDKLEQIAGAEVLRNYDLSRGPPTL